MRNHLLLSAVAAVVLSLLAVSAKAVANPLYPAYVLSKDPVLYWSFEATFSNYTAIDTAADAALLAGLNDGIGVKNSTASYPAAGGQGVLGNAVVFTKGTSGSLGHAIEYTGLNSVASIAPDSYSVQMWVKSAREVKTAGSNADRLHYFYGRSQDSNPTMSYLSNTWQRPDTLAYSGYNLDSPRLYYMSFDGGSANAATDNADGQNGRPLTTVTDLSQTWDEWHHVALVRESSGFVSVYLDGKLEIYQYDPLDPAYSQYVGNTLAIGVRPDYGLNATLNFTGLMDEVAVWDRPLSAGEAKSLYVNSFSPYPYVANVLADRPTGYWRLEETAGTNVAYDSTGNGNSWNYRTTSNVSRTGTGNDLGPRPYDFLGMPADNKAPSLTGQTSYLGSVGDLLSGQNNYTAEMWIRPGTNTERPGVGDYLLHRGPTSPSSKGDFWGISSTGTTYTSLYFYDGTSSERGETLLTTDAWHHVAMVREGNDIRLYLNGAEEFSATMPATNNFSDGLWAFGGRLDLDQQWFSGNIDEIAIYGSVLSPDDIRAHYLAGVPEPSTLFLLALGGLSLAFGRRRR